MRGGSILESWNFHSQRNTFTLIRFENHDRNVALHYPRYKTIM